MRFEHKAITLLSIITHRSRKARRGEAHTGNFRYSVAVHTATLPRAPRAREKRLRDTNARGALARIGIIHVVKTLTLSTPHIRAHTTLEQRAIEGNYLLDGHADDRPFGLERGLLLLLIQVDPDVDDRRAYGDAVAHDVDRGGLDVQEEAAQHDDDDDDDVAADGRGGGRRGLHEAEAGKVEGEGEAGAREDEPAGCSGIIASPLRKFTGLSEQRQGEPGRIKT